MWIVSRTYDLFFFHLSTLTSVLVLFFFYSLQPERNPQATSALALSFYFVFAMVFDLPHIFQTFSRTHFDREEFQRHKVSHTYGFAGIIFVSLLFVYVGEFDLWMEIFAIFGYYHILKQNIGFIMAYKYLKAERNQLDFWLDKWGYFLIFFVSGLPYFSNRPGEFSLLRFDLIPDSILYSLYGMAIGVALIFLGRQVWRYVREGVVNDKKILVYCLTLGVNLLIHQDPTLPLVLIIVLETIYHDIQYQGWMIHYQKQTFEKKDVIPKWLAASLLYGLVASFAMNYWPFSFPQVQYVVVFVQSITFYHYYIDGKIWKFGRDKSLKERMLPNPLPAQSQ